MTKYQKLLLDFVDSIGIEGVKAKDLDAQALAKMGHGLRAQIEKGVKANNRLKSFDQNPAQMVEFMLGDRPGNLVHKMHETVQDFNNAIPLFVIGEAFVSAKFQTSDGGMIEVQEGDELCMDPSMFQYMQASKPFMRPAKRKFLDVYNQYKGEDLTGKTLFVTRSGGIGDLIFIRPLLLHLKAKYDCKIIMATRSKFHGLVSQWTNAIDVICDVPFKVSETLDAADYHLTFEGVIERCKEAETLDVYELFAKQAYLDPKAIDFTVPMNPVINNPVFDMLSGIVGKYVVMQTRASSPTRSPLMGTFVQAINCVTKHGYAVVLSDGTHNYRHLDHIISCCESPTMITNFAKHTKGLQDAVKLINGAAFVVAPDSSHAHIAGMQQKPLVALYGPFPARCRISHYKNAIAVEPPESGCCDAKGKACFQHATRPCAFKEACWHNLDNEKVKEAIRETIGRLEGQE